MSRSKRNKYSNYAVAIFEAVVVALLLYAVSFTSAYKRIGHAVDDLRWKRTHRPDLSDPDIVLIAIDDRSLDLFSSEFNVGWPWPREFYALVLDYLTRAGASTVVFDLIFSEPEVGRLDVAGGSSDRVFSEAITRNGKVILAATLEDESEHEDRDSLPPFSVSFANSHMIPEASSPSAGLPLALFRDKAAGVGITNLQADEDGICRRLSLAYRLGDKVVPQLALAAYLHANDDRIMEYDPKTMVLITEKQRIRLDTDGLFPVRWYGAGGEKGVYRYDSFQAVLLSALKIKENLEPIIPLHEYRDKKVIICGTAAGLLDLKPTPFTSVAPYPGGEIHATVLNNLLAGHRVLIVPYGIIVILTLIFMVGFNLLFLSRSMGLAVGFVTAWIVAVVFLGFYAFMEWSLQSDMILPLAGVVLGSGLSAVYRVLSESRAKRQIRNVFSRYLSEAAIEFLMENPDEVDLQGKKFELVTVLFTDLQGFTTFSENREPHEIFEILNRYFEKVTTIVARHNGVLDKYTGDGIMAFFGAPLENRNHTRDACEAILDLREERVDELIDPGANKVFTRIGICNGPAVIGNLGSRKRMDFTAIGDTVNLAARLEGVNKVYRTTNILSESAVNEVRDRYCFRELDEVRVKGKETPVRIYTLIDRTENITAQRQGIEDQFQRALETYRQRKWEAAIQEFKKVLELDPGDRPSRTFIERCEGFMENNDTGEGDCVFSMETK